jgi:hypothetical protein
MASLKVECDNFDSLAVPHITNVIPIYCNEITAYVTTSMRLELLYYLIKSTCPIPS